MSTSDHRSLAGPAHPFLAALCLVGCFLYMALSEPMLNRLGFHYTDGGGSFIQRIHPGGILVFISFLGLLFRERASWQGPAALRYEFYAYTLLLAATVLIFVCTVMHRGFHGLGFLIDTHMVAPMIALVLAYTPMVYARRAALFFIAFAALDAVIGIGEAVTHLRIYTFDPNWPVLHETSFRASSLMGHPIASTLFLPVALFTAISLDLPRAIKIFLSVLFPVSLLAFGGYFALAVTVCGMGLLGANKARHLGPARIIIAGLLFACGVALIAAQIYLDPVERAAALAEYNYMLGCQIHAFAVFPLMSLHEIAFGVSSDRIIDLAAKVGVAIPQGDIDDPWVLMFLIMGGGLFALWLVATAGFLRALTRHQSLALACALLAYFAVATTSNSFGRKDVIYPATIGLVACAGAYSRRKNNA